MKKKFLEIIKKYLPMLLVIGIIAIIYRFIGCPIRYFFGVCCPGCGMTRAAFALLKLDFVAAFSCNPMIYVLPIAFILFLLRKKIPEGVQRVLLAVGILLFFSSYIIRLLTGSEYVYIDLDRGLVFQIIKHIIEHVK